MQFSVVIIAMASTRSAGLAFRQVVAAGAAKQKPVQLLGAVNAYCAVMAEKSGAEALYISGSGVATASYGLPDLGITDMHDVLVDVSRITSASSLPVLVDIDVGWGGAFNIGRTIKEFIKAGAAGVHIEDQVAAKRCGHRPGKQVVSTEEMADRVRAAVDARDAADPNFVIMARTDAFASHGMDAALERSQACIDAGADMLFPEALFELEHYRTFNAAFPSTPILANITEFGQTELFSQDELGANGVSLVLYPLSAHRAMAKAAMEVYGSILANGHQKEVVPLMQTRAELYDVLDYHTYEDKLDSLFKDGKGGV